MKNNKTTLASFLIIVIIAIGAGLYSQQPDQMVEDETVQNTTAATISPEEKTALQATAFSFVETAEIYVQDGHNLRLKEPQPTNCKKCFTFVFDHYGDPGGLYELTVRINDAGQAEWVEEQDN
ncbi:hypothetical protein WH96_05385 [Kiloniella spongiae]|uniref:Uncharacterized protein n=1 Tax=Kiloniella spongiae TaxID=1489064 RepID=A0A0H2MGM3_9PROT|nr:hypothetical protein [Kiloniella spongiae]KLN61739.1 hypothetical protein WH96_05385 [Kiloniella spongiae]